MNAPPNIAAVELAPDLVCRLTVTPASAPRAGFAATFIGTLDNGVVAAEVSFTEAEVDALRDGASS